MEIRTYTNLWNIEKRMYRFYDVNLPYPVSLRQIGTLFGIGIPWIGLMVLLGIPFGPPIGHAVWIFPPAALVWLSNRPIAEGKKLMDYSLSQIRYFLMPRTYADGVSHSARSENRIVSVDVAAWKPS